MLWKMAIAVSARSSEPVASGSPRRRRVFLRLQSISILSPLCLFSLPFHFPPFLLVLYLFTLLNISPHSTFFRSLIFLSSHFLQRPPHWGYPILSTPVLFHTLWPTRSIVCAGCCCCPGAPPQLLDVASWAGLWLSWLHHYCADVYVSSVGQMYMCVGLAYFTFAHLFP